MNINCLNNKIATSNGILQTILNAILDLYNEGNKVMSHKMVRQKCNLNDKNFPKSGYNSAISNAMRNSIQCGGRMINEYSVKKDFTIAFDGNGNNLEIKTPKKTKPKDKPNSSSIRNNTNEIEIEKLILSKNFKVVLVCASGKNDSFFATYPNDYFVNNSLNINEHHPDEQIEQEKITWREYLINNQNDNNLLESYKLYTRNEYRYLYRKFKNDFYILSAGWGLVNSEYKLPNYDITFSNGGNVQPKTIRNQNLFVNSTYNDFKQININNKEDIVFSGGKAYLNLFYNLTMNINSRKIIFYFGARPIIPNWVINPINFHFVRYVSDNKWGWHYEAACNL